jgi:hypothetical protein
LNVKDALSSVTGFSVLYKFLLIQTCNLLPHLFKRKMKKEKRELEDGMKEADLRKKRTQRR